MQIENKKHNVFRKIVATVPILTKKFNSNVCVCALLFVFNGKINKFIVLYGNWKYRNIQSPVTGEHWTLNIEMNKSHYNIMIIYWKFGVRICAIILWICAVGCLLHSLPIFIVFFTINISKSVLYVHYYAIIYQIEFHRFADNSDKIPESLIIAD